MIIRPYEESDATKIIPLIAEFRVSLGRLKKISRTSDLILATNELHEFLNNKYSIFVAVDESNLIHGYIVCRMIDGIVWAESLYVQASYRNKGLGSLLYEEVEKLAKKYNNDTVYNWIHPNNDKIINFLRKRGYNVLNLIELRKPRPGESLKSKMRVDKYEYDY